MTKKKTSNGSKIIYGLIIGTVLGLFAKYFSDDMQPFLGVFTEQIKPIGSLFNKIIFMVVVPIVFCSLVSGITSLGKDKIGRIGIDYYKLSIVMVFIALVIAYATTNIIRPGEIGVYNIQGEAQPAKAENKPILQSIVDYVPSNPFEAIVNSNKVGLIPIMVFAIFVGFALLGKSRDSLILKANQEILGISIRIVDFAMVIAPVSVAVLMFTTIVTTGTDVIVSILGYVAAMMTAMTVQLVVVCSVILLIAGKSPRLFFINSREIMATAIATTSSAVTTPVAMRVAEEKMRLDPEISKLVLTLGITGNKTATVIFQVVAVTFIAQACNIQMDFSDYAVLTFTAFISGIVTAGIPGAAIPVIAGLIATIGAPAEAIGLIVAVDRVLDMFRTLLNVSGNMVIDEILAGAKSAQNRK